MATTESINIIAILFKAFGGLQECAEENISKADAHSVAITSQDIIEKQ